MKTENEIIASNLGERKKLWVELKQVPTNDKFYANAKALLEVIEATDDWEEPVQEEVVAKEDTQIDGRAVKKGDTIKVYEWQFKALQRFLKLPEAAKKAAALLLFACLLAFGFNAGAQTQINAVGSQGSYHVYYIAGLTGTNGVTGTNTYATGVTNYTYITNANWTLVNGSATNASTITTNYTVNIPGLISVVNNDLINIVWALNLNNSGSGTATLSADYSDDLLVWKTGALTASLVANGTTQVSTNITLSGFGPGYIRFNTIAYPSATLVQTNVLSVSAKAARSGPF